MGIICHHAIVVTSCFGDVIEKAHAEAVDHFIENVSPLGPEMTNRYRSFCVFPDGSKERPG